MSELPNAPLVEALVEIRWGKFRKENDQLEFTFSRDDTEFFTGQFKRVAEGEGFESLEILNDNLGTNIPHIVRYRFREKENTWPCYQIGLGVLTINQVNEGYKWESFKQSILKGIKMLDMSYPGGLASIPSIGIEMLYKDGFLYKDEESGVDFLTENLKFNFEPPTVFLQKEELLSNKISKVNISFNIESKKPAGSVIIKLYEALINGQPGMIMDTTVRSADEHKPNFDLESLTEWIEKAHDLQRHAFTNLIQPRFAKKFK